jgi:hypothetical protein
MGAEPIQKQDFWDGYLPPEQDPHCVARGIRHIMIERRILAGPVNHYRHIPIQSASIGTVDLRREEQGPDVKSTPSNDRSTSIKTSRLLTCAPRAFDSWMRAKNSSASHLSRTQAPPIKEDTPRRIADRWGC